MKARFILPALFVGAALFIYSCTKDVNQPSASTAAPFDLLKAKQDVQNILNEIHKLQGTNTTVQTRDGGQFIAVPDGSVDAISNAIQTAGTNGVVYLRKGTHTENSSLEVTTTATIVGEDGAVVKIKSNPGVPGADGLIPLNPGIHVVNAPNSAIANVSIVPLDPDGSTGILFENSQWGASVRNNFNNFQFSVVVEKTDNAVILGNKIVGSTLRNRGGVPLEIGVLVINGKSAYVALNESSGNMHGIFVGDKYGTATQNYLHDNFIGATLCGIGGLKLPSGTATGSLVAATNWKFTNNRAENNTTDGFLLIHGANDNLIQANSTTGNGGADIDLSGPTMRFGFPATASFNNNVIAGAGQRVKDCGNGNHVSGGTLLVDPCIDKTSSSMVMTWNLAGTQAITNMGVLGGSPLPPMPEARFYAIMDVAMHDALNNIVPLYKTYALNNATKDNTIDPDAAVAQAAHDVMVNQFPPQQAFADSLLTVSLNGITAGVAKTKGIALGKAAASAILTLRANDGAATAQIPYTQGTLPGQYRSTPPFDGPPFNGFVAVPGWGNVTTFGLKTAAQFRPDAPYAITSSAYTADYNEIKTLGRMTGSTRTADQTQIALFWLENAPLAFNRIARTMVTQNNLNSWDAARLFALLEMAESDANVACIEAKFYYNYWRPITAVRLGDSDGNPDTAGDPTWDVLAPPTPPVPDYPSNHATNGGAAAAVLQAFFGSDAVNFTQTSSSLPNVSRTLTSFSQASRENALSRIYVGYHFRNAVDKGEAQGKLVGKFVFDNYLTKL